ncbi:hypothetical protein BGZ94_002660 [Podila epigama]|nr:hypothetical protein BGZ94_002660 [Podila epigama]
MEASGIFGPTSTAISTVSALEVSSLLRSAPATPSTEQSRSGQSCEHQRSPDSALSIVPPNLTEDHLSTTAKVHALHSDSEDILSIPAPSLLLQSTIPPPVSAALRVFSIQELADNIAQFLRPVYMHQLRLVSRALYCSFRPYLRLHLSRTSTDSWRHFPPLDQSKESKEKPPQQVHRQHQHQEHGQDRALDQELHHAEEATLKEKEPPSFTKAAPTPSRYNNFGKGYGHLVHTISTDTMDNLDDLKVHFASCTNLSTLSITRWKSDITVFKGMLSLLPSLRHLTVSFYIMVDLNQFLEQLTSTKTTPTPSLDGRFSPSVTAATNPSPENSSSSTGASFVTVTGVHSRLNSITVRNRVPDVNYVQWRTLKSMLNKCPALESLSLAGIEFVGMANDTESDPAGQIMDVGGGILEAAYGPGHLQRRMSRPYPQMRSLSLALCQCSVPSLLEFDRIFPNLTSLELNKCRSEWLNLFDEALTSFETELLVANAIAAPAVVANIPVGLHQQPHLQAHQQHPTHQAHSSLQPPPPPSHLPFQHLTRLKLLDKYESDSDLIYKVVKRRTKLRVLETQEISLKMETLLDMVNHCAEVGQCFERLSLSLRGFPSTESRFDFWRLYESKALQSVKHLYIQQELFDNVKIRFAESLTSLHIGTGYAGETDMVDENVEEWNAVLRRLPHLEILKVDRYLADYELFRGLGRCPSSIYSARKHPLFLPESQSRVPRSVTVLGTSREEKEEDATMIQKEVERLSISERPPSPASVLSLPLLPQPPPPTVQPKASLFADTWNRETDAAQRRDLYAEKEAESHYRAYDGSTHSGSGISFKEETLAMPSHVDGISDYDGDGSQVSVTQMCSPSTTSCSASCLHTTDQKVSKASFWGDERPFLQELSFQFGPYSTVRTSDVDRELVGRFRFLEKLTIASSKGRLMPSGSGGESGSECQEERMENWKKGWRPGLRVEFRNYEADR